MPNTVIQLKKSATPTSAPADLANGELAINFADGKLFYKNTAGFIAEFSGAVNSFGTVNANGTLVVSDTSGDILTLLAGNNITIVGDAVNDRVTIGLSNDVVVPGTFKIGTVGGDEGGEIVLGNAITNSVLAGDVKIDVYQNRLRFFESGSPNRGAFIDLSIAGSGVGSNLLATGGGTTDTTARATAEAAFAKANAALPNTNGATFAGSLTVSTNLTADKIISTNNGQGENFKVGDDAWIGDFNISNAIRIKGQQDPSQAYINFGTSDGTLLGRSGSGNLTYGGNTVWHAGVDGAGSGLDADLLDGQQGSFYAAAATLSGANTAVGAGANAFASSTIAGANTAVGTGANSFSSATIAGANTAVGTGANAFATAAAAGANAFMTAVQNGSNTAIGAGANAFTSATIAGANTAVGTGANTYLLTTLAGANTAVGAGANAFATAAAAGANAFMIAVQNGSNTAVGTGANAFASATIAGANTAVGAGANTYANGTFVRLTAGSQTITGDLSIVGNLSFSGNTSFSNVQTLSVTDPLIFLASNNTSDIVDIGFIGLYSNGTANVHTGLYREHEDKMYYLFQGYDREPVNNHIGALSNNMTLAVLNADIRTSNLSLAGANLLLTLAGSNTAVGAGANTVGSAAFARANAALANTTGTFVGDLTVAGNFITTGSVTLGDASTDTVTINGASISLGNNQSVDAGTLFIDATNNRVGVGTTAPAEELHVDSGASEFAIQWNSTGSNSWVLASATNRAYIRNKTTSAEVLTILNGGNIGVGTASPAYKLDVFSSFGDTVIAARSSGSGAGIYRAVGSNSVFAAYNALISTQFDGTMHWYIGGDGVANTIVMKTGTTERMRITSAGSVGVGTNNPSTRLHVLRDDFQTGYSEVATLVQQVNASNTSILAFGQVANNRSFIEARNENNVKGSLLLQPYGGRVGVATTSPSNNLSVTGGATVISAATITTAANAKQLQIGESTDNADYRLNLGYYLDGGTSWKSSIQSLENNVGGALLLNPLGGDVGIGTTSPLGTSGYRWMTINGPTSGAITSYSVNNTEYYRIQAETSAVYLNAIQNIQMVFLTNNIERMRITNEGRVGINNNNPSSNLHVVGTANITSTLSVQGADIMTTLAGANTAVGTGANTVGSAAFIQANAAVINANLDSVNATRYVVFDDAITGQFTRANVSHGLTYNPSTNTITSNTIVVTGNIAIGRTTSGFSLDVVGTINASNVLINGAPISAGGGGGGGATILTDTVNATRYVTFANNTTGTFSQANVATSLTFNPSTGTLSATIFNSTSDINSKQNIKTIENGLNIINSLRGVSFDWKDTGKPSYGLIAQEVEKHVPALVDTDENGKKSLNYDAVIGFLVEAIKELSKDKNV